MDVFFNLNYNEEDMQTRLNLDELYEKKQQRDLTTLGSYNKILNRIHVKIKMVARNQIADQFCWYIIPEVMIGIPKFDHGTCTAYIMDKLRDNGFNIRYTHPNLLFISWKHWVPSYVRNEIKKQTGVVIDGYGNKVDPNQNINSNLNQNPFSNNNSDDINSLLVNMKNNSFNNNNTSEKKDYKDINSYKPSGKFIYNSEHIKKLETKFER